MRRLYVSAAVMFCLLGLACLPIVFTQLQTSSVKVKSSHTKLVISNVNGGVQLLTGTDSLVKLNLTPKVTGPDYNECKRRISEITIAVDSLSDSSEIRVTTTVPTNTGLYSYGVDMDITLPAWFLTDVTNSNGQITASGFTRKVRAYTSNGTVALSDISGDVDVRTSNGKLELDDIQGSVKGVTSNGKVTVDATLPDSNGECRLETSNGEVKLTIPTATSAQVYASTSNGQITVTNLNIQYTHQTKDYIEGTLGTGVNDIHITTSNGVINLTGR
jgi:hypothetical protein